MKTIKCDSCGGVMQLEEDRSILSCPYCGAVIKNPESTADLEKFRMKHEEEVRQRKTKEQGKSERNALIVVACVILGVILLWNITMSGPHRSKMKALDAIIQEIYEDIENEDYESASVKVTRIRLEDGYSDTDDKRYENIRKDLEELIRKKR